jgi:DNA polymerase-3 subunit epsilon
MEIMEKLFFFDLETTGLDAKKNAIHQFSGAVVIGGEIKERFNYKIRPFTGAYVSEVALSVSGTTRQKINQYPSHETVYEELMQLLGKYCNKYDNKDKFHLVGYNNVHFDNQFLRAFFDLNEDKYFGSWFWGDSIDCYILASNYFRSQRGVFNDFKQGTVAKRLGIEVDADKLHDAEYDIDICMQIFERINREKDVKKTKDNDFMCDRACSGENKCNEQCYTCKEIFK